MVEHVVTRVGLHPFDDDRYDAVRVKMLANVAVAVKS